MPEKTAEFKFKSGLKPHMPSRKDWSHHRTFGAAPLSDLPDEYLLLTDILNQGSLPHCTSYCACAIAQAQFGKQFDPEKFYADEGVENGSVSIDGYGLRTPMATGVDIGFRDLQNPNIQPIKEAGYYSVDGPYDLFDSIQSAMWLAKDEKACVLVGTMWYREWTYVQGGVITDGLKTQLGFHSIKCAGWKKINGESHLVMQNSFGESYGDKGVFYFPRKVVNREFKEGRFMWRPKLSEEQIRTISRLSVFSKQLALIIKRLIHILGFSYQ